jgi:hypothetical protein
MGAHFIVKLPPFLRYFLIRHIGYWPPFLGAGISIVQLSRDYLNLQVALKLSWYNRNYVGTQFGGSLYSMTDPFYMLMLMHNLGPEYVVWDLAARVQFKTPGRTRVTADFNLTKDEIENVRRQAASGQKVILRKKVIVYGESKNVVAVVRKSIYIRKRV